MIVKILRYLQPEKISFSAGSYARGAVKFYMPQYGMIAREVSAAAGPALLDIGTGPGVLPLEIGKLIPSARIIGMDISERMIEIAQKNKKQYAPANVSFGVMDAGALPFKDNALDMIVSTDALHHWKRPVVILNEIYRCLKPGCQTWIYDGFSRASNADIDTYTAGSGIFALHSLVRLMLAVHGFSQKEYDTTLKDMVAATRFRKCVCEKRGVMMRICLRKEGVCSI